MSVGTRFRVRRETVILAAIALGAIGLRLVRLGDLSLAGDEETTTLAALALLEGWPPTLPGGLVYLRALPFTILEALTIAIAGVDEFSLRLVPVLAAGARVVASWWLARSFLAPSSALAVAGLMAIAPFDIEFSRVARMYSLFAALDLIFVAWVVQLVLGGRGALGAALCGAAGVLTHQLGVLHAPLPLLAALVPGLPRRLLLRLAAVAAAPLVVFVVYKRSLVHAFGSVGERLLDSAERVTPLSGHFMRVSEVISTPPGGALVAVGVLAACALTVAALRELRPPQARVAAVFAGLAWVGASPVLGMASLLAVVILGGVPLLRLGRVGLLLLGAGGAATLGWALAAASAGPGLAGGLNLAGRLLLGLPAPNWFEFGLAMPGLFILAIVGMLVAADRGARSPTPAIWLMLLAAALAPALVGGLVRRAEPLRFQLHALGPLLVLAFLAVETIAVRLLHRRTVALTASILVIGLALRPDQSLRIVLREHGPVGVPFASLGVAPDHRGAAAFVRANASPDDLIAAEDALQQRLYLGRTSFWLRRLDDASTFLRRDARDGTPRDIYVGARHVGDLEELRAVVESEGRRVVWVITSGEVEAAPRFYRTPETHQTFEAWRPLARFTGADGMTRVYLVVDGEPQPPDGPSDGATPADP